MTVAELKRGEDYSITSSVFPSMKNDIMLIKFIVLGGVWGDAPPGKFFMFQPLRLLLVASEHQLGRSLSVISTGSSSFNSQMLDVSPTARSTKLQLVYGLKMSKIAALDTFTIQTFYMYMYCMYGGWLLSRGGSQLPRGRVPPPP